MPFSEFIIIRPENKETSFGLSVAKMNGDNFRITVSTDFLAQRQHDITLWLIVCNARLQEKDELCFRSLIWATYQTLPQGAMLTDKSIVESIHDVRYLERDFNAENSRDGKKLSFDLSKELVERSYLCHEFPVPVLDGGQYSTIDLPAFAEQANDRHRDKQRK